MKIIPNTSTQWTLKMTHTPINNWEKTSMCFCVNTINNNNGDDNEDDKLLLLFEIFGHFNCFIWQAFLYISNVLKFQFE